MSARARRRRALVLLSLALACGGLAASQVGARVRSVERRVGPPLAVVVARRSLPADATLRRRDLALRQVPERFLPPDALASLDEATGTRSAVPLAAGGYVTAGQLQSGRRRTGGTLRRGERAVEIAVAGGDALGGAGAPGTRVDVLVSTEPHEGSGRTFLALEDVELLGLRVAPGTGGDHADAGSRAAATAVATLRVTVRQAVYLTAAQNFARELRLLPRPPGDGRRVGGAAVGAGEL